MEKRQLGQSALYIPPITVGSNVFGWTVDEASGIKLLDRFLNAGFNFIDTSDSYSRWVPGNKGGESETIIGKWLKRHRRDRVILATKVGSDMGNHPGKKVLKSAYILEEVENSLRRLQTDYIDLYQSHYDDPDTPVAETLEAYDRLVRDGKVRYIGASNFTVGRFTASLDASAVMHYPAYQSIQPLYNLYDREAYEKEWMDFARETGVGVICYYSLASGFLTGKYRSEEDFSKSTRGQGMKKYLNIRGLQVIEALDRVSKKHGVTAASVALAWLIHRPGVTSAIASATHPGHVEAMVRATGLALDDTDMRELNEASAY